MFRKIPWFFSVFTFLLMVKLNGPIKNLINIPSFIMAVFFPLFILMSVYRPGEISRAVKVLFAPEDAGISAKELKFSAQMFSVYGMLSMGSGVLCTLLGIIFLLSNLSDPSAVPANLSVSMVTILYSIGIILFLSLPAQHNLNKAAQKATLLIEEAEENEA